MSTPAHDLFSEVGSRVKLARGKLDQAEFAKRVGLAVPSLSRLENAKVKPQLETLVRISRETRKPIEWFLGDDTEIDATPQNINEALEAVRAARRQLERAEEHLERILHDKHASSKAERAPRAEDILDEPIPMSRKRKRK